jgi:tight adherence protein C
MILLLFGLLLLGLATATAARAIATPRLEAVERVAQIGAYGFADAEAVGSAGSGGLAAAVDAIAGRIGSVAAPRIRSFSEAKVRNRLMGAGFYGTQATNFLGYRILSATYLPLGALLLSLAGGIATALAVLMVAVAGLAGWLAPVLIVRDRAQRRLAEIEADLPELIDLLVLMVEAGLGFSGSIRIASGQLQGPLGNELRLTLQEQNMGLSMNEALSNMLDRCETPSMRSFVRSVLQGERLGVSIGAILRNLAVEMRKRRRQAAEERAQKAPIKMLFPLVFLIFPAIFIVLLYPALHSLTSALGS